MSAKQPQPLVVAHDLAKTFDVSAPWLNRMIERKPRQMLNAVDGVMHHELSRIFLDAQDDPDSDLVVLTGAGDKAFSSGNDLKETAKRMARGVPQADWSIKAEPLMDVDHVGQAVAQMAAWPLATKIFLTEVQGESFEADTFLHRSERPVQQFTCDVLEMFPQVDGPNGHPGARHVRLDRRA